MPMFMCRWPNGDLSFVQARSKEEAIIALDEWDNAELAEIMRVSEFMVDFRLNADGELEVQDFGEAIRVNGSSKPKRSEQRFPRPSKKRHLPSSVVLRQKDAFPVWTDVWLPFQLTDPALTATRKFHPLEVIGRLKLGESPDAYARLPCN